MFWTDALDWQFGQSEDSVVAYWILKAGLGTREGRAALIELAGQGTFTQLPSLDALVGTDVSDAALDKIDAAGLTTTSLAIRGYWDFDSADTTGAVAGPSITTIGAGALPIGGVYTLRRFGTDQVARTGRSKNLEARGERLGRQFGDDYYFNPEYRTDVHDEQRALEHYIYELYPEARLEYGGLNRIRAMDPSKVNSYLGVLQDFLDRAQE